MEEEIKQNAVERLTPAEARLSEVYEELKSLYCGLYHNDLRAFDYFTGMLLRCFQERKSELRALDEARLADPDWCSSNRLLGMEIYIGGFAGTLKALQEKLSYFEECGVNCLHLSPPLSTARTRGHRDGGYATVDFRNIQPELGTMKDLETLADECRKKHFILSLDFMLAHTSDEHPWAKAARAGSEDARARYFFFDDWALAGRYGREMPQVFPVTAPDNFTWLEDCQKIVMTTFHPYQWDLNYGNPMVFNDMTENLLYLANRGIDALHLNALPYLWKEPGTACRDLPQVHMLIRMLRLACYIVCPGVLLTGDAAALRGAVLSYFGTPEHPECQMLSGRAAMCAVWHTVATRDTRLLRRQLDQNIALPREALFMNYLRDHDDIGWDLDYEWLRQSGFGEVTHKKYLNDWFTGRFPGSPARGELFNNAPALGDARLCGATGSFCGLESAGSRDEFVRALNCDLMLHAFLMIQSGVPILYAGDEIGRLNDYTYHSDPDLRDDSRWLHRGALDWTVAELRHDPESPQGMLFRKLRRMTMIRAAMDVFRADAYVRTFDTGSDQVLGVYRKSEEHAIFALFNFSESPRTVVCAARRNEILSNAATVREETVLLDGYGFAWISTSEGLT